MKKKRTMTAEEAKVRLADLCSRSEQCSYDLRAKLKRWEIPPREAEEIISFLTENKFLSDSRYAAAFAHDKVLFSSWGKNKIRFALIAKRFPSETISKALAEISSDDYRDALKRCAIQKSRELNLFTPEDRQKLFRFLLSRGFEGEIISRLIASIKRDS